MEVTVNDSNEGNEGLKHFTGVFNMYPVSLNPNKSEMETMGMKPKNEPDYFVYDKDDKTKKTGIILTVFLENKYQNTPIKRRVSLFLKKQGVESKKEGEPTKHQCIDAFGKTCFITEAQLLSKDNPHDWVDTASLRKALSGEPEIIEFIACLINSEKGQPVNFQREELVKIFNGDVSGIKKVFLKAAEKQNAVRVLLGVKEKDGKHFGYVYDKKFDRPWSSTSKYFHKAITQNSKSIPSGVSFGNINSVFNERDFDIREIKGSVASLSAPGTPSAADAMSLDDVLGMGSGPGVAQAMTKTQDPIMVADDDLPF